MRRGKDFLKTGYRKEYFDTDLYCFAMKRYDDPHQQYEWRFSPSSFLDLKNRAIAPPRIIDLNGNPIYKTKHFKEQ